jgi:hypothetical protein
VGAVRMVGSMVTPRRRPEGGLAEERASSQDKAWAQKWSNVAKIVVC